MQFFRLVYALFFAQIALGAQNMASRLANLGLEDVPSNVLSSGVLNDTVVFGYTYESVMNVSKIPWDSLTHLVLAFFQISDSGVVTPKNSNLSPIVDPAHKNGVKVIASIGGSGDGSAIMARVIADSTARAGMTSSIVDTIRKYNLDGVDYDYEFPETIKQVQQLYTALKDIRSALDSTFGKGKKILTTTLFSSKGQFGPNVPKVDAKPFSDIVDYGLLMSYDYFGSFSEISAPNSPFYDVPGYPGLSFTSSISAWLSAGWDPKKLVAGLAYYGRTAIVNAAGITRKTQFMPNSGATPPGGPVDKIAGAWTWSDLRDPQNGALSAPSEARNGWQRYWDNSTQTPWLFHNESLTYIGYDDLDSLAIKANHIITKGLVGAMVWMIQYDYGRELESVIQHYSDACSRITKLAYDSRELNSLDPEDEGDISGLENDGIGYSERADEDDNSSLDEESSTHRINDIELLYTSGSKGNGKSRLGYIALVASTLAFLYY